MTELGKVLLEQLGPDDLEQLAARLEPFLRRRDGDADGWLDSKRAASHLGISLHALHRLTAERRIPFHQSAPGARCWFRRVELDNWRQV